MNRRAYLDTLARLRRGESVNLTPEQAAGFIQAQTREQVREGVQVAGRYPQPLTADALPERLTLYRGCSVAEVAAGVYGLSWTRSRAVAEWFAWRWDDTDAGRCVVATEVRRADVLAFFGGRGEVEAVADVDAHRYPVEVIAREPSAMYWDYTRGGRAGLLTEATANDSKNAACSPGVRAHALRTRPRGGEPAAISENITLQK